MMQVLRIFEIVSLRCNGRCHSRSYESVDLLPSITIVLIVHASEIASLQQTSCYSALQDGRMTE